MLKALYQKNKSLRWLWLSILIFILDQWSKSFIVHHFYVGEFYSLTPFLNIAPSINTGASFSFLAQAGGWQRWFFIILTMIVCVLLLNWLIKLPKDKRFQSCALSLLLGGALGNFWDRVHLGYVNDFIDFHLGNWHFATFNIADSAISVGVMMLMVSMIFVRKNNI
jgi:signal peptidase II